MNHLGLDLAAKLGGNRAHSPADHEWLPGKGSSSFTLAASH